MEKERPSVITCVDVNSNCRSSSCGVEQDDNNNNTYDVDVDIENEIEQNGTVFIPGSKVVDPEVADALNFALGGGGGGIPPIVLIQIALEAYPTFNLEKAVCNHGFFMMAPNKWHPPTKTLCRPLKLNAAPCSNSVIVALIRHSLQRSTVLQAYIVNTTPHDIHHIASPANLRPLTEQIKRMLRISVVDEHASTEFQKLYPEAAAAGFCRLFRSPTLFEDIIKSVLLINCGWGRSLDMAQALCEVSSSENGSLKRFPDSKEVASLDVQYLKERCKLGFRADIISAIAHKFEDGSLPILLHHTTSHSMLLDGLLKIRGIGDFVAANVSMCTGIYTSIPIDSETKRHVQQMFGMEVVKLDKTSIMNVYNKFAPYQCLAYWFQHVMHYESHFGKLSEMDASSYGMVASSNFDAKKTDDKLQINELSTPKKVVKKKKKARFSPYKYKNIVRKAI